MRETRQPNFAAATLSQLFVSILRMWKKNLYNYSSTHVPAILNRAIVSADSCCPSAVSRCASMMNSTQFLSPSTSSCSASCFLRRPERESSPVAGLYYSHPGRAFARDSGNLFLKSKGFCSHPNSAEKKSHCWNCGAEAESATPFLFCQACRSVQPVDEEIDYFQIFALERKYVIELEELEKKYKDWQKKLHPDLVHSKSQRERDYAAEQSARVIDAYRTLRDPLLRAIYTVKLEGVPVDEEERITDPELLAEIMELREEVEEAQDAHALNRIQAQLGEKLQYWSNSFNEAYISRNYEDALASIRRMTYYKRANEEIVKKL